MSYSSTAPKKRKVIYIMFGWWDGVGGVEIGGGKTSLGSGNLHANSIIMDKRAKNSIQDN
jgi:hypothetical protein